MSINVITVAINIQAIISIETNEMPFDNRGEPIFAISGYFINNVSFIFGKEKLNENKNLK